MRSHERFSGGLGIRGFTLNLVVFFKSSIFITAGHFFLMKVWTYKPSEYTHDASVSLVLTINHLNMPITHVSLVIIVLKVCFNYNKDIYLGGSEPINPLNIPMNDASVSMVLIVLDVRFSMAASFQVVTMDP